MKSQWWWNGSFEDLMTDLEAWLAENPDITVSHMDWKFVAELNADSAGNRSGSWYLIMLYK
jgi:hypothetical protein